MSCDVNQYLPQNDRPEPEVERLIHLQDMACFQLGSPKSRRRRFAPQRQVKCEVIGLNGSLMRLTGYENRRGYVNIELSEGDRILRKLHTHPGHRNPGGCLVDGTHMHFPTRKIPLRSDGRSYAYGLDVEIDSLPEGIRFFCELLNIRIEGIQGFLGE